MRCSTPCCAPSRWWLCVGDPPSPTHPLTHTHRVVVEAGLPCSFSGRDLYPSEPALARLRAMSPSAHAHAIRAPCLFLLGMQDRRVPPSQGLGMYHYLRAGGVTTRCACPPARPSTRARALVGGRPMWVRVAGPVSVKRTESVRWLRSGADALGRRAGEGAQSCNAARTEPLAVAPSQAAGVPAGRAPAGQPLDGGGHVEQRAALAA